MKVLIACSGFKDVLKASQVCECLEKALLKVNSELTIRVLPLSDGGEGFIETLSSAFGVEKFSRNEIEVIGPLGGIIRGEYGILNGKIGVVELAKMSGIEFVPKHLRNPYFTTSHGTGQAIRHLYDQGIRELYIGLGGSATTDGGLSVLYGLQALDFEFTGNTPPFITGSDLLSIKSIKARPGLSFSDLKVTLACDVNNPMLGPNGSAKVFGPQKGITEAMMEEYEKIMHHVNSLLESIKNIEIGFCEFTGAAGGISGGLLSFFPNLTVLKGINLISQALDLEEKVIWADLIITGEGCFDSQTAQGKVVSKIQELCKECIIVCGINRSGITKNIYDLNSRFGDLSMNAVEFCIDEISKEIYMKEIIPRLNKDNK